VLEQLRMPEEEATRFQFLALAVQDLWLAEQFRARSSDAEHFGRLRARFFAALRTIGEHGAALERAGLVILDPSRPWIAPLLAEALRPRPIANGRARSAARVAKNGLTQRHRGTEMKSSLCLCVSV
jgi:hypothetical protein